MKKCLLFHVDLSLTKNRNQLSAQNQQMLPYEL